jgi:hypothetical protein
MRSIKIAVFFTVMAALLISVGSSALADTRSAEAKAEATASQSCPTAWDQAQKAQATVHRGRKFLPPDIVWSVWQHAIAPARHCLSISTGSTKAYLIAYTLGLMHNLPPTAYWRKEFLEADELRLVRSALAIRPLDPDLAQLLHDLSPGSDTDFRARRI